ncbi:MAG: hypothetical protein E7409_07290 [Ruminococcaceae bacterium]|nr:hypothetical protein [Oscillospiraceae bacterium]
MTKYSSLVKWRKHLLSPVEGSDWASEMTFNPAIIRDPDTGRIHMLTRTIGPYPQARLEGREDPVYPSFFGYGWSDDGENFEFDLSRPALAPAVHFEKEDIYIRDIDGNLVPDYTNGSLQDPRLFFMEGRCYLTAACRMFPSGPSWKIDCPTQCTPKWALGEENPFPTQKNPTVNVLYEVDLNALDAKDYDNAFRYVTILTQPEMGEDRDVFFFPKKMKIDGEECYVLIHRPVRPDNYGFDDNRPCIAFAAAKDLRDFGKGNVVRRILFLRPDLDWQKERVAGSVAPIDLGNGEWLFNYHAKKDAIQGYAQSFMILQEQENDFPAIKHICAEPMIVPEETWEMPAKFSIPCLFTCGLIEYDGDLLCSYGVADQNIGLLRIDYPKLMEVLRRCGEE